MNVLTVQCSVNHLQMMDRVENLNVEMEGNIPQNNVKMEELQLVMDVMTTEWLKILTYVMEDPLLQQIPEKHVKSTMNLILTKINEFLYEVME